RCTQLGLPDPHLLGIGLALSPDRSTLVGSRHGRTARVDVADSKERRDLPGSPAARWISHPAYACCASGRVVVRRALHSTHWAHRPDRASLHHRAHVRDAGNAHSAASSGRAANRDSTGGLLLHHVRARVHAVHEAWLHLPRNGVTLLHGG